MPEDVELIKRLEKDYNIKLPQLDLEDIARQERGYSIDDNKNVTGLNLNSLELTEISFLENFKHLTRLNLHNNRIIQFPLPAHLKNLTHLYMSNVKLTDFTFLGKFKKLVHLYLSSNRIIDISFLKNLKNLDQLSLGFNEISDISPLKNLSNLTILHLKKNRFSDVSVLAGLKKLRRVDVSFNKITRLPPEILDLNIEIKWKDDSKGGIILEGNPLETPPKEIVTQGKEAISEYFKSLETEVKEINEVRVFLVGDGAAGKTSLLKQILGQNFDLNEDQTHGTNIADWQIKSGDRDITAHFWDFGGQEIMHATHQLFLSKRSLYILVLDSRRDEKIEHWLKHIETLGGDSPVLVVINKIDENPGFDVNRKFLLGKYKNIKAFFRVSCATGEGIEPFSKSLIAELGKLEYARTVWPGSWFNVKARLEKMAKSFIDYNQYTKICLGENIEKKVDQDILLNYLHDLGIVVHFNDPELKETIVAEPKWITGPIYKIINSREAAEGNGIFKLSSLNKILKTGNKDNNYPVDTHNYIVGVMKKFELSFQLDKRTILVPDLLQIQEPSIDFDYAASLKLQFHYDFLPRSIMPRFIVRMNRDIKESLMWRTGVVLEKGDKESAAVIKVDHIKRVIFVYVNGEKKTEYLKILRETFSRIHNSFSKLEITERIPLPDREDITVDLNELEALIVAGRDKIFIGKLSKEYPIKDLLEGIEKIEIVEPSRETYDTAKKYSDFIIIDKSDIEPALGVEAIAEEISKILLKMKNEKGMMVGIFGRWGRGKTYLMEQIWKYLSDKQKNKDNPFYDITFHAWKYQDTPACWAYLYEKIAEKYYEKPEIFFSFSWIKYGWKLLRLNLKRKGLLPVVGLLATIVGGLTVFSIFNHISEGLALGKVSDWLGISLTGIASVWGYFKFVKNQYSTKAVELFKKYSAKHSFAEFLGVQAEIQSELKILLKKWIPGKDLEDKSKRVLLFVDDIDRCSEERIIQIIDSLRVMLEENEIYQRVIVVAAVDETVLKRAVKWKYSFVSKSGNGSDKDAEMDNLIKEYFDKLFLIGIKLAQLTRNEKVDIFDVFTIKRKGIVAPKEEGDSEAESVRQERTLEKDDFPEVPVEEEEKTSREEGKEEQDKVDSPFETDIEPVPEYEIEQNTTAEPSNRDNEAEQRMEEFDGKDGETDDTNNKIEISDEEYKLLSEHIKNLEDATPRKVRIFYYRYLLARNLLNIRLEKTGLKTVWENETDPSVIPRLILNRSNREAIFSFGESHDEANPNHLKVDKKILQELEAIIEMVVAY